MHLWQLNLGDGPLPLDLLAPDELARLARLRDDQRREHYAHGRALLRRALSHYAPVPPQQWRFAPGPRGKPHLASPELPVEFSLSHSHGLTVCAVTAAQSAVGIDIEDLTHGRDALTVAEQFFSAAEIAGLRNLPETDRGTRFVQLWALKEALVKARESSLEHALAATSFDLTSPQAITVTEHDSPLPQWRFTLVQIDNLRILALAVRTTSRPTLHIRHPTNPCLPE